MRSQPAATGGHEGVARMEDQDLFYEVYIDEAILHGADPKTVRPHLAVSGRPRRRARALLTHLRLHTAIPHVHALDLARRANMDAGETV